MEVRMGEVKIDCFGDTEEWRSRVGSNYMKRWII